MRLRVELPNDLELRFPGPLDRRLQYLLDRQDRGDALTDAEREEAEGLVAVSDLLSFLRLQTGRVRG